MKTKVKFILSLAVIVLIAGIFNACSKKDDPVIVVDKTALNDAITAAKALIAGAVEGKAAGQYTVGSKATYQAAIDAASSIATSTTATATDVANAVASLATATTTFSNAKIQEIDPTNLVAYWKFDDGSGTAAADASGNSHPGTLTVGSQFAGSGAVPTWVADRAGNANKALHFTRGGHVLVASNAAFNPTELTVALWVNLDSITNANDVAYLNTYAARVKTGIYADNYIVSQNFWQGWKFQTQEAKKPFGTVATTTGTFDRDTNDATVTMSLKKWYHIAMSFKDGEMDLYINGLLVKQWTDTPGALKTLTDRFDFVIGQEQPNAKIGTTDPGYIINHYEGSMDEVRVYKKALTTTQIKSIYDMEKP